MKKMLHGISWHSGSSLLDDMETLMLVNDPSGKALDLAEQ
jgi:hypothetical protein